MEDDGGLELSLGLSCGSTKSKVKDASSDPKGDEATSSILMGNNMTVSDDSFKKFFKSGLENQESKGKQKSDPITQPQENFFTDLAKCSAPLASCPNDARNNLSQFTRYQDLWISGNKNIEAEEEKSGSRKRKLPFEEINFQSKPEKMIDYVEKLGKNSTLAPSVRNPHVSITTEDGSTGENEDVAESEAGPQSWLVSQREENTKGSDTLKFNGKLFLSESSGIGSHQKEPCFSVKEPNSECGKATFGIPLSLQPLKVMNAPYPVPTTVPSTSSGANAAGFPSSCVMQLMPIASGEHLVAPTSNANNMQLAFGYPSIQLPTLETGSSWAFNSQSLHVPFTSREHSAGVQNQEHLEDGVKTTQGAAPHKATAALSYDGKSFDPAIGGSKKIGEPGISVQAEDEGKSRMNSIKANEAMDKPAMEGFSREGSAIRPGIAPNLKFGGSGSYPDLPWVSTTGQGPNGKTISGVTYKYNQNQIKIVCACHGTHMSPEEFVQHASSEALNSDTNPDLASFPTGNPTNSAQS